ncbi:hypothetical protein MKX03_009926 [Papaver bracteatum]|nr:hypothetical protein MKX03_029636 [Papaver bracteatum]KAI3884836.1 hypothetical protein MKX03_009926 [Papaver bracteatum]
MTTSNATPTTNATPTASTTQQTEVGSSSQAASHTNEEPATPTSTAEAVEVDDSKKKHGKVRSSVWQEMTRINDTQAECHHCHKTYAAHNDVNGTSGLRKHLDRCPRNPNKKKVKGQPSLLMPPPKPVSNFNCL